jgi:hypothetical protein
MVFGVQGFAAWYWFGPSAYLAQELVLFSIDDGIWNNQRATVSGAVVRMLGQSLEAFRRPDDMVSKRRFSKGTFGSEMHLIP